MLAFWINGSKLHLNQVSTVIATCNLGIDDSTYVQLKAPINAKIIKIITN